MLSSIMVKDTLHSISQGLLIPTMVILLIMVVISVASIGSIIVELFTERRRLKANIPELLDEIHNSDLNEIENIVKDSGLLKRQKKVLIELLSYKDLPIHSLQAVAQRLIATEETHYEKIISWTDMVARLGPMFGLMGTLIPLGPGLLALGQGDTKTLSESLLTAFDTTVAGIVSAAVCFAISKIRKVWYEDYMISIEAMMECILEEVDIDGKKVEKA